MADFEDACARCDVYDLIRSGGHRSIDCEALQRALRLGLEALPILRALRGASWAALPLDVLRNLLLASVTSEPSLTDALLDQALPGRSDDLAAISALLHEVVAAVRRTKRLAETVIAKAARHAGAPGLALWTGLEVGDEDADGRTSLHRGVLAGDSSSTAALVAAVDAALANPSSATIAPLTARTSRGYRCLDLACAVGNAAAVETLLRLYTAAAAADSGISASAKAALLEASDPAAEIHETLPGWTAVHLATRGGHAGVVLRLLKELPHFQATKPGVLADGSTLLHIAVTHHHPRLALALLELYPEWTWAETAEGSLPIHLAAQHGVSPALFEAITKVMVAWQMMGAEGGASPQEVHACAAEMDVAVAAAAADLNDLRDGQGCNVAMLAAQFGKRSLLAWLLGDCHCAACRGADPVESSSTGTAAIASAAQPAPCSGGDSFSWAMPVEDDGLPALPLTWSCTAASSPLIDGQAANAKGWTPFLMACKAGMNACVRTLAPGADFTATQANGYNALMLGAMADKVDAIIDVARDAGKALPQMLSHTAKDGMLAVHVAAAYGKPAALAAICKEMCTGPLPADASGMSPLHHAAQCGSAECVRVIVSHYTSAGDGDALRSAANAVDGEGWPPITLAAQNGHADAVKLLIAAGADPNKALPGGTTPLTMACQQRHAHVVALLAPHAVGTVPASIALFMSVVDEETHCCRALIAAGVDVNAQSPTGSTALLETKDAGAFAQASMLLLAGVDVRASALSSSDAELFAAASGRSGDDASSTATRSSAKKSTWGAAAAAAAAADDGVLWPSHRGFVNPAAAAAYYGHDEVLTAFIRDKGCTPRALLTAVDDYGGSPLGWLAVRGFRQLAARRASVCGFAKADYDPFACACQPVSQFLSDAHFRSATLPEQLRAAVAAMQADEARTPFWSPALLLAAFHGFPAAAVAAIGNLQAASHGFALDPNARFPAGMSLVPFYNSEVVLEESLALSPVEAATLQGYPETVRALQSLQSWIPTTAVAAAAKAEPVVSPLLAEASAAIRAFLLDAEGGSMSFAFVPIPHIVPAAVKLGACIGRGAFGAVHLSHYDGFRQPKGAAGGSGVFTSADAASTAAGQQYPVAIKLQAVDVTDTASRQRLWREIATQLLCTYVRWAPTGPEPVHRKKSALLGFNVVRSESADPAAPSSATAVIMLRRREGTLRALLAAAGGLLKTSPATGTCPSGIPLALAVSAAWQLTQSLGQLHWRDRPLMHADLKSDNCLWYISDAASEDAVLTSVSAAARLSLDAIIAAATTSTAGSLSSDATIAVELCDYGLSSLEADADGSPCRRYLRTLPPEVRNRTGRYTTQGDVFCLALIFVELVLGGKWDAARIEQLGAAASGAAPTSAGGLEAAADATTAAAAAYQALAAGAAASPATVDDTTPPAATYSSLDASSAAAPTAYEPLTAASDRSAGSAAFDAGLAALRAAMAAHVPSTFSKLVVSCLSHEPRARPTLREVHEGLLQVLQAAPAEAAAGGSSTGGMDGVTSTLAELAMAIRAAQQQVAASSAASPPAATLTCALDAAVAACDKACALATASASTASDGVDESAEQPSHQCAAVAAWPAFDWLGSAVTLLRIGTSAMHRECGYRVLAQLLSGDDELPAALCWRAGIVPLMCAERVHLAEAAYCLGKVIDLAALATDAVKAALPGLLAALTAAMQASADVAPVADDDDSASISAIFGAAQLVMGLSLVPVLFTDASLTPGIAALGTAMLAAAGDAVELPWSQLGVLLWAGVDTRQAALVEALLVKGVESPLNSDGTSALHLAVARGSVPIVEALCKALPDLVSAPDQGFRTPLHAAAATGNTACGEALLAHGADVAAVTAGQGRTPLHELCGRALEDDAAVVLLGSALVAAGAKVNAGDATGNTPLHLAVACGSSIAVQLLLARGADKTKANRQGVSAKTAANRQYLATGDPTIYALLQ